MIKYRFQVDGSQGWYTHDTWLDGRNSSTYVPQAAWEAARRSGKIEIVYSRSNPARNRPVDAAPIEGLSCPAIGTLIFGTFALVYWVSFFSAYMRAAQRNAPAAQTSTQPEGDRWPRST